MSDLTKFRDYAAAMANGGHTPECLIATTEADRRWSYFRMFREWLPKWGDRPSGPPQPCDGGCTTAADRALWALLAAEVDEYLAPQPDLFGDLRTEPTTNPTPAADREQTHETTGADA